MFNNSDDSSNKNKKIFILLIITCSIFFVYVYRLFVLQILKGETYHTQSQQIASRESVIPAPRGEIYDRNADLPLVINVKSYAVEMTPGYIPSGRFDTVAAKLANILGIPKSLIDEKIPANERKRDNYQTYTIKSNVPFNIISNIAENKSDLPGVSYVSKPIRNYLHTPSLTHVVGFVGDINKREIEDLYNEGYTRLSVVGKSGIEKQYDKYLQGKPGKKSATVDAHGRVISDKSNFVPPEMGENLILTIDSRIQKLVEDTLGEYIGAIVVLKPATGEVLAMASYPNSRTDINRAVQGLYPPASTFKIVMSTAMLQENVFPPEKKIECKGKMFYGGREFNCHLKDPGHGWLELKDGFGQSCDVYYWTIGRDYLGIEKIASYATEFGFGAKTGIDLPVEAAGVVPTPEWKKKEHPDHDHGEWLGGDTMNVSIGQGYLQVTPLQLANMVAMVSNEGVIYKPHVLKERRNPVTNDVIEVIEPEILTESSISNEVWKDVQYLMRYCVTDGTPYYPMFNKNVQIACKTGTGEAGYDDRWHSWLAAYAPFDAPPEDRICVATVIEASNEWHWYAPYATNIIIQGIFCNQTFEEAYKELGFSWYINQIKTHDATIKKQE